MKAFFLFLINIYRKYISGLKRQPCCRYYPTCSQYAYTAIKEWGVIVGSLMGIWRILRCNPLVPGGVDHVPLKGAKKRSVEGYTVFYARSPYSRACGARSAKTDGLTDGSGVGGKKRGRERKRAVTLPTESTDKERIFKE